MTWSLNIAEAIGEPLYIAFLDVKAAFDIAW